MNILILGPTCSGKKNGGVAVFDEGLIDELCSSGNHVILFTMSKPVDHIKNVEYITIIELFKIKSSTLDVVISSLAYSFLLFHFRNKVPTVHLLHGFTNLRDYPVWKFLLMQLHGRIVEHAADIVLANSEYTKMINTSILGNRVDGIFRIGLENKKSFFEISERDRHDVLYVGRVEKAKNVQLIAESFQHTEEGAILRIIGDGSIANQLCDRFENDKKIQFLGPKSHTNILNYYRESKVFISLNPSEPFGITYMEAVASGMYVIAPNSGGQVEFLKMFPGRASLIDIGDTQVIAEAISKGLSSQLAELTTEEKEKIYSYQDTIHDIIAPVKRMGV